MSAKGLAGCQAGHSSFKDIRGSTICPMQVVFAKPLCTFSVHRIAPQHNGRGDCMPSQQTEGKSNVWCFGYAPARCGGQGCRLDRSAPGSCSGWQTFHSFLQKTGFCQTHIARHAPCAGTTCASVDPCHRRKDTPSCSHIGRHTPISAVFEASQRC